MEKRFYQIYLWAQKHKFLFFLGLLLTVLMAGIGAWKISFEEDITRILPQNEKTNATAKVINQMRFSDKITVLIEKSGGTVDDMMALATVFLDTLETKKEYIKGIQGRVEEENINEMFSFVYAHLPLFLDEEDYKELEGIIRLDSIPNLVANNYRTLVSPTGLLAKQFILKDPFGMGFRALKKLNKMNIGDDFHLVDGFLLTRDEERLLVFIDPVFEGSDTAHNTMFTAFLNEVKEELNDTYKEKATIDYFGASFVAVANAKQIKKDIQNTVAISISILMILLMAFYRKLYIPLVLFVPTLISALLALLVLYFIKDTISAISLSIGAILIGITIDYALHIMTHYKHCGDAKALYQEITRPIIMSAATTAIAFLCLVFVHSEALRDLGIFASITVMGSGVVSLLVIPHLYKPSAKDKIGRSYTVLDKVANFPFDTNKGLLAGCLLVLLISLFTFSKVGFNSDLASLNYFPEHLKKTEQKLESSLNSNAKSLYLTFYGDSIDQVVAKNSRLEETLQKLQDKGEIIHYSSLGELVLSSKQQHDKIRLWEEFWRNKDREAFQNAFQSEGEKWGFTPDAYQPFFTTIETSYQPISISDYAKLNPQVVEEFLTEKEGFYTLSTLVKLPEERRELFLEDFPATNDFVVIDRKEMNEVFLGNLLHDFNRLINYSLIAVFVILWFFFRRVELAMVCMIPIVITGIITAGLMRLFHIEFNIFSTIVCTLIFGQGVDFTIFITNSLQKEYTSGQRNMATYRASIILAIVTTLLAVGTLVFAKHPALQSISWVAIIGMSVAALISFVVYPHIFRICFMSRQRKGKSPISIRLLLHSTLSFIYFGLCGFLYSVVARLFLLVVPLNPIKKLRLFGKGMSAFMTSVLYSNPFVKKEVRNPYGETFEKPAILIANHTSFLDSLVLGMVNPHIVFLVNDWVYNSPVFGKAIQLAGFYPVSEGVDKSIDPLEKKVKEGFSLMVFPEGTRSDTNEVQRFHKGAFFLAERLQLDIIPVYVHGNAEVLPKGDHIIYDGHIITTIGKRIKQNDIKYGATYSERTKKISKYFKAEFAVIRKELEGEEYFRNKLHLAYLYKEKDVRQEVYKDFELHKMHYFELNDHLSVNESIMHWANDYGQIDFLITLQQSKRKVYTFIREKYRRQVAETSYLIHKRRIVYLKKLEDCHSRVTTLVVNTTTTEQEVNEVPESIKKIVVIKKKELVERDFSGFEKVFESNCIIVWNKKSNERTV